MVPLDWSSRIGWIANCSVKLLHSLFECYANDLFSPLIKVTKCLATIFKEIINAWIAKRSAWPLRSKRWLLPSSINDKAQKSYSVMFWTQKLEVSIIVTATRSQKTTRPLTTSPIKEKITGAFTKEWPNYQTRRRWLWRRHDGPYAD